MSDAEAQPDVDDLLEAVFADGKNGHEKSQMFLCGAAERQPRCLASRHAQVARNRGPQIVFPRTIAQPVLLRNRALEVMAADGDEVRRTRKSSRSSSRSRSSSPPPKKRARSGSRDRKSKGRRDSRDRKRSGSRSRDRSRDRRRRRSPSHSPSRSRSRSKERRSKDRRRRDSRSPVRRRSPSPPRRRYDDNRFRRDRSPPWRGRGGGGRSPPNRGYGNGAGTGFGSFGGGGRGGGGRARQSIERARSVRSESPALPPEERDQRTVFAMQLAQTINAKDLEKFFSSVGKVRDVRLIVDSKTRRSKGIAYIEFRELEAVPLALGLHGQKLKNCPMNIQPTHAEKNRAAMAAAGAVQKGPMRLYVGSLHFNITEDMLKDIFEPFGKIDSLQLMMDTETNRSRGYAFITFRDAQDAKRAMEQLNGFELAGRAMKIGHVTDRTDSTGQSLDNDDNERIGFDLGPTGRLQLMAKLAEGTGMKIPQSVVPTPPPAPAAPIATQCFMLSNMFDLATETEPNWDRELRQEIIDECSQYGGVVHVDVDKTAPEGIVYVKSMSVSAAAYAVQHLHGRYFAGKMITANYIPTMNYHQMFPESLKTLAPLKTSTMLEA